MNLLHRLSAALTPERNRTVIQENERVNDVVRDLRQSTERAIYIIEERQPTGIWLQDMMLARQPEPEHSND